jgi:ABC-type glycerol-3-phosphate transport system substrate-binding protein
MAGWAGRGGAHVLDDFVDLYNISPDDYWPATWAEGVWQGKVYSIPFNTDGRFIFWNKEIFEAAGLDPETSPPTEDWAAMMELAAALTTETSDGAIDVMGLVPSQTMGYGNGGDYVYAWANGGQYLKDERTAWMNNPKLVETLQWELDMVEAVGGIEKAAEFSSGWPTVAGFSPFGAGKLAMTMNGDWNLKNFSDFYPDLQFGMAPWRMRGNKDQSVGFAGGFCLAVPAGTDQLEATFEFLNFLNSYDSQTDVGVRYQTIPCLKRAALSDILINTSPYPELRRMANESMEYAKFRPISPVGQEIQDLWTYPGTGRDWVLYGQKTAQEACDDMNDIVQKALDDYWASV